VKGFGCRPIGTSGLALGPASESLRGRNPRGAGATYGDFGILVGALPLRRRGSRPPVARPARRDGDEAGAALGAGTVAAVGMAVAGGSDERGADRGALDGWPEARAPVAGRVARVSLRIMARQRRGQERAPAARGDGGRARRSRR
jgi:hypothetical protein